MNRDHMIARVRSALGHPRPDDSERLRRVESKLSAHRRNCVPRRAVKLQPELARDFAARLTAVGASVEHIADPSGIPERVAAILSEAGLPPHVRTGSDPFIAALPWSRADGLTRAAGAASAEDRATLSHALAGIAETGTLVLASGPENPVTLSFLPELSIVTLAQESICGSLEDGFDAVRHRFGPGLMPRTVSLVSAPSRTGDIGGRLVMGAHGPRRLVVIVVGAPDAPGGAVLLERSSDQY